MYDLITVTDFDSEKTIDYKLSIQVSLDGFSFSIVNPDNMQLLAFKHTPLKISNERLIARRFKEWCAGEALFQHSFSRIKIIISTARFSIYPHKFDNNTTELSKLLFEIKCNSKLKENNIEQQHSKLVFALPEHFEEVVDEYFPKVKFEHPVTILLNSQLKLTDKDSIVLLFDNKHFFAQVFKQNKLQLTNSFKITHVNDVIYYLVALLKQLDIHPANAELLIGGEISQREETVNNLVKYFTAIAYLETPFIQIDRAQFTFEPNNFFSLLSA